MSLPTGTVGQPDFPRRIETKHPTERASVVPFHAEKQASQGKPPAPKFGGVADAIATGIGKVGSPNWIQDAFLFTAKESPKAIYPLEASVLVGRTKSAYDRDGWMEVQERVFEEVAAAVIWIQGVDVLKKVFNGGQRKFFPGANHLNPDIAWNRPWGKARNVDLTAQELFSKNSQEIGSLLRVKSARWAFSVGLALTGVAVVVPTLNQLKTEAIMSYQMSRRKRSQEGDNVQFGDPRTPGRMATGAHRPNVGFARALSQTPSLQSVFSSFPFRTSIQSPNGINANQPLRFGTESQSHKDPIFGSNHNQPLAGWRSFGNAPFSNNRAVSPQRQGEPRFGSLPGGSLVQGLGHMVEQTPYGSILVVDAGIAGGRSYVASKRSAFETVEVLVRDIGSLYFYILSVPHIMKFLSKAFDKGFNTSSHLEPKVASKMNEEILDRLKSQDKITERDLKELLHGRGTEGQLLPEGWLKTEMRKADKGELKELLELESKAYLPASAKGSAALQALQEKISHSPSVMPEQIQEWLKEINAGKGKFGALGSAERQNLGIALKQAFRHTVGVKVSGFKAGEFKLFDQNDKVFKGLGEHSLFVKALKNEGKDYLERIRRMAQIDVLDQSHSMLRRSINLLRDKSKIDGHKKLFDDASKLADWLDQSRNSHLHFGELKEFAAQTKKLGEIMPELAKLASGDEQKLLKAYQGKLEKLMNGTEGRLFSLAIDQGDEGLTHKLREMLQGGLHNDTAFMRKAQGTLSQFTPDSREFIDPAKAARMREAIGNYGDALLDRVKATGKTFPKEEFETFLNRFLNLNRNLNYTARAIAMVVTMFGLGWLVPHVQTTITKRLTGKDKNPGIASAAEALGYGKAPASKQDSEGTQPKELSKVDTSGAANGLSVTMPYPANGVFVGRQPQRYYPGLGQSTYQS